MKRAYSLTGSGLLCLLLVMGLAGCAVDRGQIYVKDGQRYGFTGKIWRDTWWNYYERGISYADGGYWSDAIADFHVAIKRRADDQRRARTTGLDAIDYFPHRELGIAYYHLKRYQDAAGELQTSLASAESAKAKFYLNATRKVLIEQANHDTAAPRIQLAEAFDGMATNQLTLTLRGRVEDDTYVSAMTIDGHRQFVELAEPTIDFAQQITLREGRNTIDIVAADLLGHVARQQLQVYVDRQGPLVSLNQIEAVAHGHQRMVRIQGMLTDESDIVRLRIGPRDIPMTSIEQGRFEVEVPVALDAASVAFEAEDRVGNTTRDAMRLRPAAGRQAHYDTRFERPRLALFDAPSVSVKLAGLRSFWRRDRTPPVITPKFMPLSDRKGTESESYVKLYDEAIFLEGRVSDDNLIQTFFINDEPLEIAPGSQIFFAKYLPLQAGGNEFVLKAVDKAGNAASHKIVVNRMVQSIKTLDSRLRLLLLPFGQQEPSAANTESAYEHLYNAFVKQGRFSIPNASQLPPDLQQLQLGASDRLDPKQVAKIGNTLEADAMLIGTLKENTSASDRSQRDLEVHVRFVDVKTSTVLAAEDVYHGKITPSVVKTLMEGLAWKVQRHFPLVEGLVIKIEGDRIFIDLGNHHAIKKGMKIILFREGETIKHPVTGVSLGASTDKLGEANVVSIFDDFSQVTLLSTAQDRSVEQLDRVITK